MSEASQQAQNDFQRDQAAMESIMDASPEVDTSTTVDTSPIVDTKTVPIPAEPVPEAKITKEEKVQQLPDDPEKLDQYLDTFKAVTPDQQKGFPPLKTHIKSLKTELDKMKQEFETLKKESSTVEPITPELKAELDELRQLRKSEDPTKDPEIQAKYINPVQSKENQALTILKANGLNDNVCQLITKEGGLGAISRSDKTVPAAIGGNKTWSEWVEDTLLPSTPFADRKRLETILTDVLNLNDKMSEEVEGFKTNSKERMETKFKKMGEEFQGGIAEVAKGLGSMAAKWEAPPDATPEQKAEVEKHNTRLDKVINSITDFQKNLNSPAHVGRMAALAGQSVYLMEVNADLVSALEEAKKKEAEFETRLTKIKGSSQSAHKTNAPLVPASTAPDKTQTTKQAVDSFFTKLDQTQ